MTLKRFPHNPEEYQQYLKWVEGKSSFLEIGARYGDNLVKTAEVLKPNSLVVSVDLPNKENVQVPKIIKELEKSIELVREMGHRVFSIIGDSKDPEVINQVKSFGRFDVIFIDGDHTYEGSKADWENYSPLAREVIFHDIQELPPYKKPYGVYRVWNEVKSRYKVEECIGEASIMGIGRVRLE